MSLKSMCTSVSASRVVSMAATAQACGSTECLLKASARIRSFPGLHTMLISQDMEISAIFEDLLAYSVVSVDCDMEFMGIGRSECSESNKEVYCFQVSNVGGADCKGMWVGVFIIAGVCSSSSEGRVTLDYPWKSGFMLEEDKAIRSFGKLKEPWSTSGT